MSFMQILGKTLGDGLYAFRHPIANLKKTTFSTLEDGVLESELGISIEADPVDESINPGTVGDIVEEQLRHRLSISNDSLTNHRHNFFKGEIWGIVVSLNDLTGALTYKWAIHPDYIGKYEIILYRAKEDHYTTEDIWNCRGMDLIVQSRQSNSQKRSAEFGQSYTHTGYLKSLDPRWANTPNNGFDPIRFIIEMPTAEEFQRFKGEAQEMSGFAKTPEEVKAKPSVDDMPTWRRELHNKINKKDTKTQQRNEAVKLEAEELSAYDEMCNKNNVSDDIRKEGCQKIRQNWTEIRRDLGI